MIDFFTFWVMNLWGSTFVAFLGTGLLFAIIGVLSRFSFITLIFLMGFYLLVFGSAFFGIIYFLIFALISVIYLANQVINWSRGQ